MKKLSKRVTTTYITFKALNTATDTVETITIVESGKLDKKSCKQLIDTRLEKKEGQDELFLIAKTINVCFTEHNYKVPYNALERLIHSDREGLFYNPDEEDIVSFYFNTPLKVVTSFDDFGLVTTKIVEDDYIPSTTKTEHVVEVEKIAMPESAMNHFLKTFSVQK